MELLIGYVLAIIFLILLFKYKVHQYRKKHPHTLDKSNWSDERDALNELFKRGPMDV